MTGTLPKIPASQFVTDTQPMTAGGTIFHDDHADSDTQTPAVVVDLFPGGHRPSDAHPPAASGNHIPTSHSGTDTHTCPAGGNPLQAASDDAAPMSRPLPAPFPMNGDAYWQGLRLIAECYDDLQLQRIATSNRLGADTTLDIGGVDFILDDLAALEHRTGLALRREMRKSGFRPYLQATTGIGEHLAARLLGTLGDPAVRIDRDGVPHWRTVSQLWSLCGHGDPTRIRRKGMSQAEALAMGNPRLKMLVHLIAEGATKEGGRSVAAWRETGEFGEGVASWPYRRVYESRRIVTEERVHAAPCVRCGPAGKPAADGSPWSDAHRHADALRIVGKEILRDLWREARRIHEASA